MANDLEAKVSMINEFIVMMNPSGAACTEAESKPNENSLMAVADDNQQVVIKADWLPWAAPVAPEFYNLHLSAPDDYAMLFPGDLPKIEEYNKKLELYLSSLPTCASELPHAHTRCVPKSVAEPAAKPVDQDVSDIASVVPDEWSQVEMIDTCRPRMTRS